jgi:hypothetical protein
MMASRCRTTPRAWPRRIPTAAGAPAVALAVLLLPRAAVAGPETALRELASGQIKKGVRSIGMGGDGATWGNYSLVYNDAGTALLDYGIVRYRDTGNTMSFTAVGVTTPRFWRDAALYLIAISQHGTGLRVWSETPAAPGKPPSTGDGANQAIFLKFALPLSKTVSAGILLSYELSNMTLVPDGGGTPIRFETAWRPSGGAGVTWRPTPWLLAGARVILGHDEETRSQGVAVKSGFLRSYEYRAGAALMLWPGGVLDGGAAVLDRYNGVEDSKTLAVHPTVGVEQALVPKRVWVRAGLDETTWGGGMSAKLGAFKLDLAYLHDMAAARTSDVFGKHNVAFFGTLTFDYGTLLRAPAR